MMASWSMALRIVLDRVFIEDVRLAAGGDES